MKTITVKGFPFFYFAKDDPLPSNQLFAAQVHSTELPIFEFMCTQLVSSNDFRMIVIKLEPPPIGPAYCLDYLYWVKETDLDRVDERVAHNSYDDSDFSAAINTHGLITKCFECGREYRSLRYDSELCPSAIRSIQDQIAHEHFLQCPYCGKPFRIPIVRIFEEVN